VHFSGKLRKELKRVRRNQEKEKKGRNYATTRSSDNDLI